MTDCERLDREELLRRAAAVAGAVYAAPVLTSSAAAEIDACTGQRCRPGKKGRKRCRKAGGKACECRSDAKCDRNDCGSCTHTGPRCGPAEVCENQTCLCFFNGHEENPGVCVWGIDRRDGLCSQFEAIGTCPNGEDSECPSGTRCFTSCCDDLGYPPLCGPCCDFSGARVPLPVPSDPNGPRPYLR